MPYTFTRDYFNADRADVWRKLLEPSIGKDGLRFLEVGTFEGQSALWLADNILTGKDCLMVCVDTWDPSDELPGVDMGDVLKRFLGNVEACERHENFTVFRGTMAGFVAHKPGPVHLAYIDGSHHAAHVLSDSVFSWELLQPGGLLIWDDLRWQREGSTWDNPATAVTAFMSCYAGRFETMFEGGQTWIRKL